MSKFLFALVGIFYCIALVAQPPKGFSFKHYSTDNGLLSNQINDIKQDTTGYIWIATNDGLVRYDGIRYKTFRRNFNNPFSIPANQIIQLLIDKKENLWLLTTNGEAGIFNTSNFSYTSAAIKPENALSLKAPVKKLITDESGNIFLLLSGHELLTWNERLNEFRPSNNVISFDSRWKINDIRQQPGTRNYWLGVEGIGLAIFNAATRHVSFAGHNAANEPVIEQFKTVGLVSDLYFDKKNRFWFTSRDSKYAYLYCFDLNSCSTVLDKYGFASTFKSYYDVNGFLEQQDGTIWIRGYKAFGFFVEKTKSFELIPSGYESERSIDYRYITALFEDRERNMWIGTGNNGMFCFNPSMQFFSNLDHISRETGSKGDGSATSFFREKDGSLLVNFWTDGLYRFDKDYKEIPLGIKGIEDKNSLHFFEMEPSRDGKKLWFGTNPGFYEYNPEKRVATFFNPPILENKGVRQIAEDRQGNLWLGIHRSGVYKWNAEKGKQRFDDGLVKFTSIPSVQIWHILADSRNFIWISTVGYGLYVVDARTDSVIMHFHNRGSGQYQLPDDEIMQVLEYNDSLMLIGTATHLLRYNRLRNQTSFLTSDQTLSGEIRSMQVDGQGNLWLSTSSNLYRVNIKTRVFAGFNRNDGIRNDYFILSSSFYSPEGTMMFGSSGQFLVFNPSEVKINTAFPKPVITDLKVRNRSINVDSVMRLGKLELAHDDNSLAIEFSTLTYTSEFPVQFKLDGVDREWTAGSRNNEAVYSFLAPGKYEFLFNTINSEGRTHEALFPLSIEINPPFYRTWWFYSIFGLALIGLLYWVDRQRIQRIRNEQEVRVSIAANLHQDVNTTLRNINVLSEIASMKSQAQPEQAKEYLQEIQHKSRNMVIAMNDVLWSIDPANDTMSKTVERLQEVAEAMRNKYNVEISLQTAEAVSRLKLDMKTRLEFITIYKLILLIVIEVLESPKHTVQLDHHRSLLQLKVFSEGVELPRNDNICSKYLDEIKSRAASIHATVDIATDQAGTWFLLEVRA